MVTHNVHMVTNNLLTCDVDLFTFAVSLVVSDVSQKKLYLVTYVMWIWSHMSCGYGH